MTSPFVTLAQLESINVAQGKDENRANLDSLGGVDGLIKLMAVDVDVGLTATQVVTMAELFGDNSMPTSPSKNYFWLLLIALSDSVLLILIVAACVSFAIGYWEGTNISNYHIEFILRHACTRSFICIHIYLYMYICIYLHIYIARLTHK